MTKNILFKLSNFEAEELKTAFEELRYDGSKINTPRKLFMQAVHDTLDKYGVSLEEPTEE